MATVFAAFRKFLREEDAPTSVEYAIMVGLIAVVVIGGATLLGQNTSTLFTSFGATLGGLGGG